MVAIDCVILTSEPASPQHVLRDALLSAHFGYRGAIDRSDSVRYDSFAGSEIGDKKGRAGEAR